MHRVALAPTHGKHPFEPTLHACFLRVLRAPFARPMAPHQRQKRRTQPLARTQPNPRSNLRRCREHFGIMFWFNNHHGLVQTATALFFFTCDYRALTLMFTYYNEHARALVCGVHADLRPAA